MKTTFGFQVNRVRGFNGVKVAKMANNPVDVDLGPPFGQGFVPRDAKRAGRSQSFCATLVLHIDTAGHISKVADSVVISNPVDVVDLPLWPFTEYVEPHEAVLRESDAIDSHSPVSVKPKMPCRLFAERAKMLRAFANEDSRLGIVLEHVSKAGVGEGLFHKLNSTRGGDAYA